MLVSALCMLVLIRVPWSGCDCVFYVAFAVVASVAVPTLGLFLVFASLIAPALWIERGVQPWIAMAMASVICLLGLSGFWVFDAPSGPAVVLTLGAFGVSALFRRQNKERDNAGQALSEFESPTPPKAGGSKTERVSRTMPSGPPE